MNVGQMNAWTACTSLLLSELHLFGDGIEAILKVKTRQMGFKIEPLDGEAEFAEWLVMPPNETREKSIGTKLIAGYKLSDYAFVCASTSQVQTDAKELFKLLGFYTTDVVKKKKEVSNMCQFHMIEMPKFLDNLKKEAEAQGLDYSQSHWFS